MTDDDYGTLGVGSATSDRVWDVDDDEAEALRDEIREREARRLPFGFRAPTAQKSGAPA